MFADEVSKVGPGQSSTTDRKLVSIVIPTYNRKRFLGICLASAAAQSYPNVEIVIVDDCSTDGTWEIIESWAHQQSNVRIYRQHENVGLPQNFLTCFKLATGYYQKWLMSDDVLGTNCVSTFVDILENHPLITLVTSKRQRIDEHSQILDDIPSTTALLEITGAISGTLVLDDALSSALNRIGEPSTVLFRKSDVDVNKLTLLASRYRWILDVALWVDLLKKGDLAYVREPLSCFRVHADQDQQKIASPLDATYEWSMLISETYNENAISAETATRGLSTVIRRMLGLFLTIPLDERKQSISKVTAAILLYEAVRVGDDAVNWAGLDLKSFLA
ncbi:MAG: glycosyltransferase family 2 protein [Ferrimicrobium sp.]